MGISGRNRGEAKVYWKPGGDGCDELCHMLLAGQGR